MHVSESVGKGEPARARRRLVTIRKRTDTHQGGLQPLTMPSTLAVILTAAILELYAVRVSWPPIHGRVKCCPDGDDDDQGMLRVCP